MSVTKRIDGDYNIIALNQTPNNDDTGFATVFIDTNLVNIDGDLQVNGQATFIQKEDVEISDNIIILNKGETGSGVTTTFSGIEIDRGSANKADLLYNDVLDQWTVDLGDTIRKNVLVALPSQGPALHNIVEDLTPQLGGSLDVNNFPINATANNDIILSTSGTGLIEVNGPLLLSGTASPGPVSANEALLVTGTDTGGGTKIHFENDTDTGELISKRKAIVFALIF